RMGIGTLIVTNAAGGVNPSFDVGDLMLIEDHINLLGMAGHNPLRGPNLAEFGPRFPPVNRVYTRRLRDLAVEMARGQDISLHSGVYVALAGPNFETPAEIRMLRTLGADAVGMSTVHEALVAHHAGMEVLAISTITNVAIDQLDSDREPTHEEVNAAGQLIVPRLSRLLLGLLDELPEAHSA
ncbi:MAG: purine-nucleoside phosphorylase, partial [Caldilineaceae bacterium]|nr:purine-nucleoside phosphorylase [Caldilineaceae bacterium]